MVERGIGRGLAAILPDAQGSDETLHQLPLDLLVPNPDQPRRTFGDAELEELADSIRAHGVLQPVLARPLPGGRYELLAGERRLRAARIAGLERIPTVVRAAAEGERLELAMIENMARQDLNPVEAARACAALVHDFGLTKEEVGRRVGRSRVAISNLVRLLELPDEVLALLETGELSEGHGRAVLQASDHHARRRVAREARDRSLSVRQTEALARGAGTDRPARRRKARLQSADAIAAAREVEETLTTALGAEVRVRLGRRGGMVEIPFDDLSEVREMTRRISRGNAA
ncbi:MAG: ParB/RepB/Spo0J family partition protein [Solirubrobacterales bacterium]